jgi:outer membrane protein TolC
MNIPLLRGAGSAIAQADLRIAGYQARAAEVALSLRTSNLAAQFAREFVLLDTLVRRRREADDALRRARDQLRTLRGLIERGILATGDALEIEAAVATRELEAIELTAEASRQSDLVLSLLGRDPRQTIETVLPDPLRWPVPTEEQLRATARTRPEVRLRQLRHSVAEENRLLAADNLRWDVSVIGDVRTVTGYDRNVFYPDQRFGSADLSYNIGVRVSVPLTTRSAELRLAQATTDVERARIEVRAATETAEREVLQLRSVLRRELDRRAATERLLAVSQEKLELERRRLELGRSGALQLRLAEEEFIRARAQVTADRARVLVAWIDILNASSSFQLPP